METIFYQLLQIAAFALLCVAPLGVMVLIDMYKKRNHVH